METIRPINIIKTSVRKSETDDKTSGVDWLLMTNHSSTIISYTCMVVSGVYDLQAAEIF